jgi:hypothetical protein
MGSSASKNVSSPSKSLECEEPTTIAGSDCEDVKSENINVESMELDELILFLEKSSDKTLRISGLEYLHKFVYADPPYNAIVALNRGVLRVLARKEVTEDDFDWGIVLWEGRALVCICSSLFAAPVPNMKALDFVMGFLLEIWCEKHYCYFWSFHKIMLEKQEERRGFFYDIFASTTVFVPLLMRCFEEKQKRFRAFQIILAVLMWTNQKAELTDQLMAHKIIEEKLCLFDIVETREPWLLLDIMLEGRPSLVYPSVLEFLDKALSPGRLEKVFVAHVAIAKSLVSLNRRDVDKWLLKSFFLVQLLKCGGLYFEETLKLLRTLRERTDIMDLLKRCVTALLQAGDRDLLGKFRDMINEDHSTTIATID